MGLGRANSKSHQILATGNRALVLHSFAVPRGHRTGASHRLAVSVAPAPVLGPTVSGARVARSPGPAPRKRRTSRAKYRQMHRTPWLLATSLPHHRGAGTRIKRIYAQRMQIEETIRDLRATDSGSRCVTRERSAPSASKPCCSSRRSPL